MVAFSTYIEYSLRLLERWSFSSTSFEIDCTKQKSENQDQSGCRGPVVRPYY